MNKREIISTNTLFDGLSAIQLEDICKIAVVKSYKRGETVFFEGDPGIGFYMVASGKVKIYKTSPTGKEHILHIYGAGETFAEAPVFNGMPFPASATILSKSELIFFPRLQFVELVEANPSIALSMLAILTMRLRHFSTQIENLSLREVPARLANYLLYLVDEQDNGNKVELDISKGQLASLLGTIPETLSRILNKMTSEGLIEVNGKVIKVLDRHVLELKVY